VSISSWQPAFAIGSPSSIKAYQRYSRNTGYPYWIQALYLKVGRKQPTYPLRQFTTNNACRIGLTETSGTEMGYDY
jgi:hypothetical protein